MNVTVRSRHLQLSDALRAYADRRLRFSVGPFAPLIDGIDVCVADVNGPRGGIDKVCAIAVVLTPLERVFARAIDSNAYSAVDTAASRIRTILVRRLRRRRESRRGRWQARAGRL